MRIKLIAPSGSPQGTVNSGDTFKIARMSLPLLAALTPDEHDVELVDETFAPDDGEAAELVGITVMTELATRAYEIADRYRAAGSQVVLGGIHPSACPDEALQHADAVVLGEGEGVWGKVVADASRDGLSPRYAATCPTCLDEMPHPRRDLYPGLSSRGYTPSAIGVEATRGCPYDCEFCSIASVFGRRHRVRDVDDVIRELASIESRFIFFVDDTLGLQRESAKELFRAMIPLRKIWAGQGGVAMAEDPELLRLMKESGCVGLLVGFESIQDATSDGMSKLRRLKISPEEAMRRFHDAGIAILGAFVFGFDGDDRDVFERTHEFIERNRIDALQLRILVPFPGTRLHTRLADEGRLFCDDWWLHGHSSDTLLYRPAGMEPEELVEGVAELIRSTHSLRSIWHRVMGMSPAKRGLIGCQVIGGVNLATRRRYADSVVAPQPFVASTS